MKKRERRGRKTEETRKWGHICSVMPEPQEGQMCPIASGHGVVGYLGSTDRSPCGPKNWPVAKDVTPTPSSKLKVASLTQDNPLGSPLHLWSATLSGRDFFNPAPLCDCLGVCPPDPGPCSQVLLCPPPPLSNQPPFFPWF